MCFGLVLTSCTEKKRKISSITNTDLVLDIPATKVLKSEVQYNLKTSRWTLNGLRYSGFVVSYYPDSTLMEKFGMVNGVKQNKFIQWYPDGHLKNVADYHLGKLHGEKKMWSPDSLHILIAQYNFHKGKANGQQKKWYPTGELYKKMNMTNGKEEGIQQAYRKNGDLYANYEAKNGRIFGLKKAALCFGLEEENIQYEK